MEKMNILLVGNEGYIGSGLQEELSRDFNVIGWNKQADICSLNQEVLHFLKIDAIVNASVVIDKTETEIVDESSQSYHVNVKGVETLVSAATPLQIPIIHLSTKDVFGNGFASTEVEATEKGYNPKRGFNEKDLPRPTTTYGHTKLLGEEVLSHYKLGTTIRLSSPYTTQLHKKGGWLQRFCKANVTGDSVQLLSNGMQKRDPLHVYDIAEFIRLSLDKRLYGLYHLGGGRKNTYTLRGIADTMNIRYTLDNEHSDYGCILDFSKAYAACEWAPSVDLIWSIGELKVKHENNTNL